MHGQKNINLLTQHVLYSFDGKCLYVFARVLFDIHSMSAVSAPASSQYLIIKLDPWPFIELCS